MDPHNHCHANHLLEAICPLLEEAEEERQKGEVEIGERMEAPGEEEREAPVKVEDVGSFEHTPLKPLRSILLENLRAGNKTMAEFQRVVQLQWQTVTYSLPLIINY